MLTGTPSFSGPVLCLHNDSEVVRSGTRSAMTAVDAMTNEFKEVYIDHDEWTHVDSVTEKNDWSQPTWKSRTWTPGSRYKGHSSTSTQEWANKSRYNRYDCESVNRPPLRL